MQRTSHIAVFSLAYAPFESGAEIACREVVERLPAFRFTVFTHRFDRGWNAEVVNGNICVIRLGRGRTAGPGHGRIGEKIGYVFRSWRAAERAHQREPIQVIWAIMASYGGIAALLFKLRHPRVPLLLTLQEGDAESHILRRVGLFYFFWKQIFRKADAVTAISSYLADFAKRHGATCAVQVIPNGVELRKFQISNDKVQTNSKSQNQNTKTIITTSRLVPKNGVDILIRAVSKLEIGNWKLEIVGDGPERVNLEKLARELGIQDHVHFAGQIAYEEIPKRLQCADMFVRPSRSEGLGSSFLEAMAAGLPVVGTPVGGIPDFLKDGETGLMTRSEDPQHLASCIKRLFKDEELYEKLSMNSRKIVADNYAWDRIAERMKTIFESVCAS